MWVHVYIYVQHVHDLDVSPRWVIGGSGWWWRMRPKPRERDLSPEPTPNNEIMATGEHSHGAHCGLPDRSTTPPTRDL
jgi:hypothetical protein